MRVVLCCGDRNWDDYDKIFQTLKKEHKKEPIDFLIEGGAAGADSICKVIAQMLGIQVIECPANWKKLGKAAGMIRNSMQLKLALSIVGDTTGRYIEVIAFHPDLRNSKGTKDMVNRARKTGVEVQVIQ
jgi:hypothetical protein